MNRLEILNLLSSQINAKTYLEIGVEKGSVFHKLNIPSKIGVDPDPNSEATLKITSDEFFSTNRITFDLIFIDGLHHCDQVIKDIKNSLEILNPKGYILCHDMLPTSIEMQLVPRIQSEWTGDCWKAWLNIRMSRSDLNMYVIDTDYGCGVISKGNQKLLKIDTDLTFVNFSKNKNEWMNVVSVDNFMKILGVNHE